MRLHRLVLVLLSWGCTDGAANPCGDLIEDPVRGRCLCPPGSTASEDGWTCLLDDGGVIRDPNAPADASMVFPMDGGSPDGQVAECSVDEECDDGDRCNGAEQCDVARGQCTSGSTLNCDDLDNCTTDTCEPATGCLNTLIDTDGDGFAPASLGTCSTRPGSSRDCDDDDESRYPGAPELCNERDDDCDDGVDESGTDLECFRDADGDGYPNVAIQVSGCSCPTGYIVAREDGLTDCADTVPEANPGQTEYRADGYMRGGTVSFDWNCDGMETDLLENRIGAPTCTSTFPGSGVCRPYDPGWVSLPPCAAEGTIALCRGGAVRCDPDTMTYVRECR
jgi:hypothetical protein